MCPNLWQMVNPNADAASSKGQALAINTGAAKGLAQVRVFALQFRDVTNLLCSGSSFEHWTIGHHEDVILVPTFAPPRPLAEVSDPGWSTVQEMSLSPRMAIRCSPEWCPIFVSTAYYFHQLSNILSRSKFSTPLRH